MKLTKLLTLSCTIAILSGCTQPFQSNFNSSEEILTYFVQSCHFTAKDITCSTEPVGICTDDSPRSDFCGQFVSCSENGEVKKDRLFDNCVDCTTNLEDGHKLSKECMEAFPKFYEWYEL